MDAPIVPPIPDKFKKQTYGLLKWVFFFIFLYILVSTIGLLLTNKEYIQQIVTLSISGFLAFFMGYFGWRGGMLVEEHFIKLSKK